MRVSRNRILDSATKVMELYAGSRAVLELEYFGEVGTGLGPTLEFYTLLSHELQKKGLGLWRADAAATSAAKPLGERPHSFHLDWIVWSFTADETLHHCCL